MNRDIIIIEAEYADILITLMQPPYCISSITKLIFIAFCVKNESNTMAYRHRTKDFVDVFFKNISLKLSAHYGDIQIMLHFIDMLKNTDNAVVSGDYIELKCEICHKPENSFLQFCDKKFPNPILEINKLDTKALVEEVIRYV